MDKLINDPFTRGLCQVLVAIVFVMVALAPLCFLIILYFFHTGWITDSGGTQPVANFFLRALALPIEDSAAQIGGAFIAAFPGLVAAVCYLTKEGEDKKLTATTDLNVVGRVSTIVLIVGAVASLTAVVLLGVDADTVKAIVADEGQLAPLLKGVFGGLLAFDLLYVTTLLGIRNDNSTT
jgi:hypothetical protein